MIEDIIKDKYGDIIEQLWIYEKPEVIKISAIIVDPKKREIGYGTKIMKDIIEYADKNDQTIILTPSSDYGGNKNRLTKFYKKLGFVPNRGKHKDYRYSSTMLRIPEGKTFADDNTDNIEGGLSDNMSIKDIAKFHELPLSDLIKQYKKGIKIEMEHTDQLGVAKEIARDHLKEDPKYYDKLATIEAKGYTDIIKKRLAEIGDAK